MSSIKEAYEKIGADYEGVVRRLSSDALVARFAGKFLQDQSFAQLEGAMGEGDVQAAFVAAHTLKGVCQNLGFDNLFVPAVEITEALRANDMEAARPLFPAVKEQYDLTVSALSEFLQTQG